MTKQALWLTNYGVREHAKGYSVELHISSCQPNLDMTPEGWVKLMDIEIPESCLPSRNQAISQTVDKLEEAAKKLQADTQLQLNEIRGEINKMLSLEYYNDPPTD